MQITITYDDSKGKRNIAILDHAVVARGQSKGVRRAATLIARLMRKSVRQAAPKRTGLLKKALIVRRRKTGMDQYNLAVTINNRDAFYAFILNAKGKHRGFINNTVFKLQGEINRILIDSIREHIKSEADKAQYIPQSQ